MLQLRDQVAVASALGNEHDEIAAYHGLIVPLTAMGMTDAVALLQANLDQEIHTGDELQKTLKELAG